MFSLLQKTPFRCKLWANYIFAATVAQEVVKGLIPGCSSLGGACMKVFVHGWMYEYKNKN